MAYSVDEIIKAYKILVEGIENEAIDNEDRSFGGIIRSGKGKLVESIARRMVEIAWENIGGSADRLSFDKQTFKVPIKMSYIKKIPQKEIKEYIISNIDEYYYIFKTDVHVNIDSNIVMGIECKAYTENAMLKRIMVDFTFLKNAVKNVSCVLLQLESQLTGDYSSPNNKIIYGSHSSHTIMSYFDVNLEIITLLEGERKVDQPIHNKNHYKPLQKVTIEKGIRKLEKLLKPAL